MSFVKFTLGDIRTAVKDKLDDTGFSDATIDRAANDFSVVASTVWNYPDTNTQAGTMGNRQVNVDNTTTTNNTLIKGLYGKS